MPVDPRKRVVVEWPLTELWDSSGSLPFERGPEVSSDDIKALLRQGPFEFVVARGGQRLGWIPRDQCFRFWKEVAKGSLYEDVAGRDWDTCFVATLWSDRDGQTVVLLEEYD